MATRNNFAITDNGERSGWTRRGGLTKVEAEQLLDWLEANGYQQRELSTDERGFVIYYQREHDFSVAPHNLAPTPARAHLLSGV
jgi:hypothetical protein